LGDNAEFILVVFVYKIKIGLGPPLRDWAVDDNA
jgi:hypothetical protein